MDQLSKIITRLEQIEESFLCVCGCVCVCVKGPVRRNVGQKERGRVRLELRNIILFYTFSPLFFPPFFSKGGRNEIEGLSECARSLSGSPLFLMGGPVIAFFLFLLLGGGEKKQQQLKDKAFLYV